MLALHAAWEYPGAQFYPGCHQLEVTGGGSTVPSSLVSFPGAYAGSDPGITYDAYKGESSPQSWGFLLLTLSHSLRVHDPGPCALHLLEARGYLTLAFKSYILGFVHHSIGKYIICILLPDLCLRYTTASPASKLDAGSRGPHQPALFVLVVEHIELTYHSREEAKINVM